VDAVFSQTSHNGSLYVGTWRDAGGGTAEIYRYDGGTTWTKVSQSTAGTIANGGTANVELVASLVTYKGELYAASEKANAAEVYRYDGGTTWTAVPNVAEVRAFGFGKSATGSTYPTVFIAGWVNNNYGIWRSIDNAVSWTKVGKFPLDQLSAVSAVEGDPDVFGRVWVGYGGNGAVFYG
jgi:hypothetical protein